MARYASDGSPVQGFGDGGASIVRPRVQAVDEVNDVLATGGGGKTVFVGRGGGGLLVGRYLRSGRPDPTFGRGRLAPPAAVSGDISVERVTRSCPTPATAWSSAPFPPTGGGLLRYLPDGSLDPSFGHGGIVRTAPFDGVFDVANAPGGDLIASASPTRNATYSSPASSPTATSTSASPAGRAR